MPGHRLSPDPTYGETPFARANSISLGMNPCISVTPCTDGARRMTAERMPRSAIATVAFSELTRGKSMSRTSVSRASLPSDENTSVPDVITSGLPVPSSTDPIVWMASRSVMPAATKSVVGEMFWNARWITPSASRAPAARLSRSESEPRSGSTPAASIFSADSSERASPSTWCPPSISSWDTAVPMYPEAPVTKILMCTPPRSPPHRVVVQACRDVWN
jgi:hypothetical protein